MVIMAAPNHLHQIYGCRDRSELSPTPVHDALDKGITRISVSLNKVRIAAIWGNFRTRGKTLYDENDLNFNKWLFLKLFMQYLI